MNIARSQLFTYKLQQLVYLKKIHELHAPSIIIEKKGNKSIDC